MSGVMGRISRWSDSAAAARRLKRGARRAPGVSALLRRWDEHRLRQIERDGIAGQRASTRWREAAPDTGLTWGMRLSGDPLVDAANAYGALGDDRVVLEIGPGYGRLLRSLREREVGFAGYIALDISERNVNHLRRELGGERVRIMQGDARTVTLEEPVDTVLSFLTFKHIYPSFEGVLANLQPQLARGGLVLFDLIEGDRQYFQLDGVTYIHEYTRQEVEAILDRVSLELVAFDELEHAPDYVRLLVVARNPG
jgi:SAM-dependent methyltransferase